MLKLPVLIAILCGSVLIATASAASQLEVDGSWCSLKSLLQAPNVEAEWKFSWNPKSLDPILQSELEKASIAQLKKNMGRSTPSNKNDVMVATTITEYLIKVDSTSGNEQHVGVFLAHLLLSLGFRVYIQKVKPFVPPNAVSNPTAKFRFNIYADLYLEEQTEKGSVLLSQMPDVLFCTHFDSVPPFIPPSYEKDASGKLLYLMGRGSNDAKGQLAGMIVSAYRAFHARDGNPQKNHVIGLLFVSGEEVDHGGMIQANQLPFATDRKFPLMIMGEPTESKLMSAQKGILKVQLDSYGSAAHSGYPEQGRCAIRPLLSLLLDLDKEPWISHPSHGETTMNIGMVQGGEAANVIPSHSSATLMFRVICEPQLILARVRELAAPYNISVTVKTMNAPYEYLDLKQSYFEVATAKYNTDTPYANFFKSSLLFGAGTILVAHTPYERIEIKELEALPWNLLKIVSLWEDYSESLQADGKIEL